MEGWAMVNILWKTSEVNKALFNLHDVTASTLSHTFFYLTDSAVRFQNSSRTPVLISQISLTRRRRRSLPTIPKNPIHIPKLHNLRNQRIQPSNNLVRIKTAAIANPRRKLRDPNVLIWPRLMQLLDKTERRVRVRVV